MVVWSYGKGMKAADITVVITRGTDGVRYPVIKALYHHKGQNSVILGVRKYSYNLKGDTLLKGSTLPPSYGGALHTLVDIHLHPVQARLLNNSTSTKGMTNKPVLSLIVCKCLVPY